MRAAPNFVHKEAVDGKWKQELLIWLGKEFGLDVLIETGTCDGGTLGGVYNQFGLCVSIELSDYYYNLSKKKFNGIDNIWLRHGNSAVELKRFLKYIKVDRALFWLDAHSSGGLTANEGDPLPEEIRAIIELSPDSLIVIDDQHNGDLIQVKEAGVNLEGWTVEYRTGIVFLYKNGNYNIPEFE